MRRRLLLLAILVASAAPQASALDTAKILASVSDVQWHLNPIEAARELDPNASVVWVGQVVDTRVYQNAKSETVIEWLGQHLCLMDPSPAGLTEPLNVYDHGSGYFVVTLRLKDLSPEEAQRNFVKEMQAPYLVVSGEPQDVRPWGSKQAVYLHAAFATISDTLKVQVSEVGPE